jgi:hydroxypyruvate isomerase
MAILNVHLTQREPAMTRTSVVRHNNADRGGASAGYSAIGLNRREALGALGGTALLSVAASNTDATVDERNPDADANANYVIKHDRIQQSVVHWCFNPMPVETLAAAAARIGLKSVELVAPQHWPTLKKHGLICAISSSHGFAKGFAHREEHAECLDVLHKSIDATSAAGFPSVITFSGFRRGIDVDEGQNNMVAGLKQIVGHAEKQKVTLCLEMLNSRVDVEMKGHPDYFCDSIELAVDVCKRIASPRMKVLFDIYHVQIMQGDVIVRLKEYAEYIGHYHTAGVPGRNELDDTQELNYPAIMKAIAATGYKGYVGQEYIPTWPDKIASLGHGVRVCSLRPQPNAATLNLGLWCAINPSSNADVAELADAQDSGSCAR